MTARSAPARAPAVAVVIVTYNSAADLPGCLAALRDGGAAGVDLTEVVVVDNASQDSSATIAKELTALPVTLVQLTHNAGYAAGFNAGVRELGPRPPDAVLLLNPDCRPTPGALAVLAEALEEPNCGIAAPRLLNLDGSLQPTLRRRPSVRGAFAEALLGGRIADRLGVGELVFSESRHAVAATVPWATGAALMMSWRMLEDVGPWDESFLLYSEETEFMLRAADRGWTTGYRPAAIVVHKGGQAGTHPGLAALLTVNKVRLFRARAGTVRGRLYAAGVLLGTLCRAASGRRTARASALALLRPSRRITSLAQLR